MDRQRLFIGEIILNKIKFNLPSSHSSESSESSLWSRENESQSLQSSLENVQEVSSEEEVLPALSPLEHSGIISVLEDTIDQLTILKQILPGGEIEWFEGYKTLKQRFGDRGNEKVLIFPQENERPILSSSLKVQRDRYFLESILRDILGGIKDQHSYGPLTKALQDIGQRKKDEEDLEVEDAGNLCSAANLRMQFILDKKLHELDEAKRDETILNLKSMIHDAMVKGQMEFRCVCHWEQSREEQNSLRLKNLEVALEDNLENLNVGTELEIRAHSEIENYLLKNQKELEKQIESWMEKYELELERKDREMLDLHIRRTKQKQEFEELFELIEHQRDEMARYIAHKEEKRLQEEKEAHLNAMATRIQAWWRGVMVRRCLGRYRKYKKGKKGKKGGAGKKSKKGKEVKKK